ncbi:uncharacterized protein [Cicer arietinum]|uniref:Uncharacterized protein LOC113784132 n=1 Tax=Cicer arietinum TaxID=3827 RepID=A0A3Q7Y6G0_CICAR|nr:uncharacterized protein LOC113784132 [Cicer arietinum]
MQPPQQFTFTSLLNEASDAAEEQKFLDLESTFPKTEQEVGEQVGLTDANKVAAEYDSTLFLQISSSSEQPSDAISNMMSHNVTDPQKNLGKQPAEDRRPLKRTIEVGESSSAKQQKKDSPVPAANEVIEEKNNNSSNQSSEHISMQILNSLYDPAFEAVGLPIDPNIRLMKALHDPTNADPANDSFYSFI